MANILDTNRQIVEAIRNLAFSACCPDIPLTEQPTQDTEILPGVGDPPATWGGEPVTDWEDWERLVCGYANGWVDRQISNANLMQTLITTGTLTVALIVGIMYVAGLLVISMGTAAGIWGGVGALYGTFVFSSAATAFEENRDEIICKILTDEGVGDFRNYMQSIIPPLAWSGFYTWLDYQHIINSIWEGQNPDGSLDVTRMDCPNCETPDNFVWDITLTADMVPERWTYIRAGPGNIPYADGWAFSHNPRSSFSDSQQQISLTTMRDILNTTDNPILEMVEVTAKAGTSLSPKSMEIIRYVSGGVEEALPMGLVNGQWKTVRWDIENTFASYPGGKFCNMVGRHNGSNLTNGESYNFYITSIRLAGRIDPA